MLTPVHVEHATKFFERLFEFRYSSAISHSAGRVILVGKNTGISLFPEGGTDRSGRVCAVDMLGHNEVLTVVSVHVPNEPAETLKTWSITLKLLQK
ncbi:hypothetical protein ANAPC5_01240 [Anaplasma phagocytophilum]|nr:hypothetical protein ANAPC5_01240 [Anaplasma phagocytophilum]